MTGAASAMRSRFSRHAQCCWSNDTKSAKSLERTYSINQMIFTTNVQHRERKVDDREVEPKTLVDIARAFLRHGSLGEAFHLFGADEIPDRLLELVFAQLA